MHTCRCTWTHTSAYTHTDAHICTQMHTCGCTNVHRCTHMNTQMHMDAHTHTHSRMHKQVHVDAHTQMHAETWMHTLACTRTHTNACTHGCTQQCTYTWMHTSLQMHTGWCAHTPACSREYWDALPSLHTNTRSNTRMRGMGSTGWVCTAALAQVLWHLRPAHGGSGPGRCSHAYRGPIEVPTAIPGKGTGCACPICNIPVTLFLHTAAVTTC